ncbi:hypothetical protein PR202_gb01090 [Eleusine coracana subsp. coracana]|uniref:CCAAT-binding factor domain-containing protein n=1 Tax=Eleusine coracana subsp. coracana TaxID=191504 RepID=A0AAV5DV23_ELECO|nr:hypothetical protein PR202_gb01090 [Eleusine coracana subsp. coracana]
MAEPNPKSKSSKKAKKKAAAARGEDMKDMDALMSDVASFASSLGLAAGAGNPSGFDDSDFRKSGPIKPPKPSKQPDQTSEVPQNAADSDKPKPSKKPHPLELHAPQAGTSSGPTTNYPLMKAAALSGQWYTDAEELEAKILGSSKQMPPPVGLQEMQQLVARKRELAEKLMVQYAREYDTVRRGKGELKLLEVSAKSGTSADKVSAFTCLVEDNPIANMRALDSLVGMVTSKVGKRYAFTGFDALKELFLMRLLPDRKLKSLIQRPLDRLPETKDGYSLLLFWHWEDCLKQRYEKFVIALEDAVKDMLPNLKDKAMKTVFILLKSKSEQERRLLTALVNKLGDPERKAASSAAYLLICLLSAHPNMKMVVIDEVDSFLFRSHVGLRAKYQAVNFLSQILLTNKGDGPKIAKRLVDVYIALFKGVNRALPYVASSEVDDIVEVQTPILFRLVHSENFNVGVQALMLLYQISTKNQIASDRFYRALYAKLLSPAAVTSSKPELFLGLLVKAMKNDVMLKRVAAFSKRLLQVALQRPPQYACGCLFILSEVLKAKSPLWAIVLQNESVDDSIEHFEDIVDTEDPSIASAILDNDKLATQEKHDSDAVDGSDITNQLKLAEGGEKVKNDTSTERSADAIPPTKKWASNYASVSVRPGSSRKDRVSWWELTLLASHVHPSVSTMARTLLSGNNIVYSGDPLTDLSLPAFLDKFMEKKPKGNRIAEGKWHGGSQIAPARKIDLNPHLIGEELLELEENEVPPEDVVFHRFYMNKGGPIKAKAKKKASVLDEDTGELLADDASDASDDEMQDLGEGPAEDGDYDYEDLDSDAFEEDQDLLKDGSDVDLGSISDDSVSEDEVIENDDVAFLKNAGDSDGNFSDEEMVDVSNSGRGGSNAEKKRRRKHGAKSGVSPFASVEDYEHLLDRDSDKPSSKWKHKVGGGEKRPKWRPQKKRSKTSG